MSKDDPNLKRLSIILVLFVIMVMTSIISSVLLQTINYSDNTEEVSKFGENLEDYRGASYSKQISPFNIVIDMAGFFTGFYALHVINLPYYMIAVILPIYFILLIAFWYLVIDFIKDIEILGSSV